MKTAVITGALGQDGSWLADLLLSKGYKVYGVKRRSSTENDWRVHHLIGEPNYQLIEGELTDPSSMTYLLSKIKPDEFYNLGAMSQVASSFEQPAYTFDVNARSVIYMLEAIRSFSPNTRFYQAGTSEELGSNYTVGEDGEKYQDENTPLMANSPYAVAKIAAHHAVSFYRRAYNVWACVGILHNHEGTRRSEEFVTRKITKWIGQYYVWKNNRGEYPLISMDDQYICADRLKFSKLRLGNMNTYRDWSDARDMVRGMWMMLQRDEPDDFMLGSGVARTVNMFCSVAFSHIGIRNFMDYIYIDPQFYRPCEVTYLRAKTDKANNVLGWKPEVSFYQMVKEMVEFDIEQAKKEL
jgi:GDPmannose 4,6-dehydratase